jgi:hypothetical protein
MLFLRYERAIGALTRIFIKIACYSSGIYRVEEFYGRNTALLFHAARVSYPHE